MRRHAPERRGARGVHRAEPSGQGWGCGTAASLSSHAALGMGGDERGVDVQGGAGGAAARLLDVLEDGLDGEAGHLSHILLRRTASEEVSGSCRADSAVGQASRAYAARGALRSDRGADARLKRQRTPTSGAASSATDQRNGAWVN